MPASIGELNERSLHRALKRRYAARGGAAEVAVGSYVADVVLGDRIVEIQTGSFSALRHKLPRLLAEHPVTLVHPIARDRFIVRMELAPEDGAEPVLLAPRRRSPKHGSPFDVFHALTGTPTLLDHPNLTLDIVMVIDEDLRVPYQGRRRRRRRDWVSVDRRLLEVVETHTIEGMADLFAMVDARAPGGVHVAESLRGHGIVAPAGAARGLLFPRSRGQRDLRKTGPVRALSTDRRSRCHSNPGGPGR